MICWFGGLQVGTQEWHSWVILLILVLEGISILIYTLAKLVSILTSITYNSFCLHPLQHLFSSVCLLIGIVTRVTWNINAVLFCISLTVSEIVLFHVSWLLALDLLRTVLISLTYLLTWFTCWVLWIVYICICTHSSTQLFQMCMCRLQRFFPLFCGFYPDLNNYLTCCIEAFKFYEAYLSFAGHISRVSKVPFRKTWLYLHLKVVPLIFVLTLLGFQTLH